MDKSKTVASLSLGLILSFTTGPAHSGGKPVSPPPPATPPARTWHGFAHDGGAVPSDSHLYMYGGNGSNLQALSDLWFYTVSSGNWSSVTPTGRQRPGPRQWMGWSCGQKACVLVNGSNGVSLVSETWVFSESAGAWSALNCRRALCPSARQMATAAFDYSTNLHLLFGGRDASSLGDTWVFDAATMKWKSFGSQAGWPAARNRAAAAHVPGLGIVMHGGQDDRDRVFCDAWLWRANAWTALGAAEAPCLHSHSMSWDASSSRLVVTGGYIDTSDTANVSMYYLQFTNGQPSGSWTRDNDVSGCYASVMHGARMALDGPSGMKVFFGGEDNGPHGAVRYGDTMTCP